MFFHQWHLEPPALSVIIEDDDRVAYAYLFRSNTIVSDVWLYNVREAPATAEWTSPDEMPFLNPADLSLDKGIYRCLDDPLRVRLEPLDSGHGTGVRLYIDNTLHAVLAEGAKPGWCRLAVRDGPLAKRIEDAPEPA